MIEILKLENGLRFVIEDIPYVHSIALGIWIKTGTRYERKDENGVSHFIEHLMFKGTEKRSARDIAEEMDAMGGQINAYTTKEYTCYYTRVLDRHFSHALDVLSDMILHSKFDDNDIARERKVIEEEIDMYLDAPEELVHDALEEAVWSRSSLGMPICGTKQSLSKIDGSVVRDYYNRTYRPQNAVVAVTGNFQRDEIIKKITDIFGPWSSDGFENIQYSPAVYEPKFISINKDVEQVHMCFTFRAPKRDSIHKYSLAVLNTLFGGGMSSRLFQRIREEEGLVYTIYSYTSAYSDTGIMTVYACTSPDNAPAVVESVLREIKRLKTEPIDDRVIAVTKEQIISNYIIGSESTANRVSSNGGGMILIGKVLTAEEISQRTESVDYASIKRAIDEIFDSDNLSFSAVGNIGDIDFEGLIENGKKFLSEQN